VKRVEHFTPPELGLHEITANPHHSSSSIMRMRPSSLDASVISASARFAILGLAPNHAVGMPSLQREGNKFPTLKYRDSPHILQL
jgi:hypothetical protein